MLQKSCCKSDENYCGKNRHPPASYVEQATYQTQNRSHENGHVKLAYDALIPLYSDIKKYMKRRFATKTSTPVNTMMRFTREKQLCIDLAPIPLMGFTT
jgi:hypothetical protein